ncbi:hypothetical protein BDY21DRAFT_46631 [Lineolata rhizophorae]|uniref:Uncharacterized protein n=1 Tax=Lineolata rhizophorae TaxID=578093 RepID=A0A6A6NYV9_9PEZI|nr:hypothetical protein BDY21DRAFT_46631 [Lineolata rhizophorae]
MGPASLNPRSRPHPASLPAAATSCGIAGRPAPFPLAQLKPDDLINGRPITLFLHKRSRAETVLGRGPCNRIRHRPGLVVRAARYPVMSRNSKNGTRPAPCTYPGLLKNLANTSLDGRTLPHALDVMVPGLRDAGRRSLGSISRTLPAFLRFGCF